MRAVVRVAPDRRRLASVQPLDPPVLRVHAVRRHEIGVGTDRRVEGERACDVALDAEALGVERIDLAQLRRAVAVEPISVVAQDLWCLGITGVDRRDEPSDPHRPVVVGAFGHHLVAHVRERGVLVRGPRQPARVGSRDDDGHHPVDDCAHVSGIGRTLIQPLQGVTGTHQHAPLVRRWPARDPGARVAVDEVRAGGMVGVAQVVHVACERRADRAVGAVRVGQKSHSVLRRGRCEPDRCPRRRREVGLGSGGREQSFGRRGCRHRELDRARCCAFEGIDADDRAGRTRVAPPGHEDAQVVGVAGSQVSGLEQLCARAERR